MNTLHRFLFLLILFAGPLCSSSVSAATVYHIRHLNVTFQAVPDSEGELRDIRSELVITYDIQKGSKSGGFKYVGTHPVRDISVSDAEGNAFPFSLEKHKENKITWYFPQVNAGEQTLIVRFTLKNALEGDMEENYMNAEWVRNWRVPVHDVRYNFILPDHSETIRIRSEPGEGEIIRENGKQVYRVHRDRLSPQAFSIRFTPGFAERKKGIGTWIFNIFSFIIEKTLVIFITIAALAGFVGLCFLFLAVGSKFGGRGGGRGGGGGGGCSGGCGGGGGGCGGGCGG